MLDVVQHEADLTGAPSRETVEFPDCKREHFARAECRERGVEVGAFDVSFIARYASVGPDAADGETLAGCPPSEIGLLALK